MEKTRVDDLLIAENLAADRKEALALLLAGRVLVDEQRVEKPGDLIDPASRLRVKGPEHRFVSRGGLKLEGALHDLSVDVAGSVCVDLGVATGGFTDCLLQSGARKVFAFDVGRGQLHWKLQNDPRVEWRDSFNVRHLDRATIGEKVDLIVGDLSFISITAVLPSLKSFDDARLLLLVKPQFEARRSEVGDGGLILDDLLRSRILDRVKATIESLGFSLLGEAPAVVKGRKGNQEVFLLLECAGD